MREREIRFKRERQNENGICLARPPSARMRGRKRTPSQRRTIIPQKCIRKVKEGKENEIISKEEGKSLEFFVPHLHLREEENLKGERQRSYFLTIPPEGRGGREKEIKK